jgi:hypothetical protein
MRRRAVVKFRLTLYGPSGRLIGPTPWENLRPLPHLHVFGLAAGNFLRLGRSGRYTIRFVGSDGTRRTLHRRVTHCP